MPTLGPDPRLAPRPDLNAPRWVALRSRLESRHPDAEIEEIEAMINQFVEDDLETRTAEWLAQRDEAEEQPPARSPSPQPPQIPGTRRRENDVGELPEIVPGAGITGRDVVRAHPFAAERLRQRKYVGLYYFTRAGLAEAAKLPSSDAAGMFLDPDSGTLRSGIKESKNFRPDSELTWEEWTYAKSGFISAMEDSKWPQPYLDMYQQFFVNLESDPIRRSDPVLGDKVLIDYLHHARKEFHAHIEAKLPCDLSVISPTLMANARARVYQGEAARHSYPRPA